MTDKETPPETQDKDQGPDLGQFKTVDDLLKSYKEIQGAFTKVSQENKNLQQVSQDYESLKEELNVLRQQQSRPAPNTLKSFDEAWMENPESAIANVATNAINMSRIEEVLADEDAKNPEEFQERYAWADRLAQNPQYASLAKTATGVRQLFKMGDKLRKDSLIKNSKKSLEYIFGEDLDEDKLAKIREMVVGKKEQQTTNSDAYMPDVSTSTKSGADSEPKVNKRARMNEMVNKGDVDGVLDQMFKDILAE